MRLLVVEPVGIVGLGLAAYDLDVVVGGVGEAVGLGREDVGIDALDDLVVQIAATDLFQIFDVAPGELVRVVPFEDFGEPLAAFGGNRGIEHDHEHLGSDRFDAATLWIGLGAGGSIGLKLAAGRFLLIRACRSCGLSARIRTEETLGAGRRGFRRGAGCRGDIGAAGCGGAPGRFGGGGGSRLGSACPSGGFEYFTDTIQEAHGFHAFHNEESIRRTAQR